MIEDSSTLPVPVAPGCVSIVVQLAQIHDEETWLSKQKSHCDYRLDVQHFMRTLSIATPGELRQADCNAVIAGSAKCARSSRPQRQRSAARSQRYRCSTKPGTAPACAT